MVVGMARPLSGSGMVLGTTTDLPSTVTVMRASVACLGSVALGISGCCLHLILRVIFIQLWGTGFMGFGFQQLPSQPLPAGCKSPFLHPPPLWPQTRL